METWNAKKIQTRNEAAVIDRKDIEEIHVNTRKLALVTGGGIRLGAAISRALANVGYRVVVHANRHIETAQALAAEIDGIAVQADLTTQAGIKRLFETIDQQEEPLSALINNAAIFQPAKPESISVEQWDLHINLNLAAPFWCAQAAHSRFADTGGAIAANVASICVSFGYRRVSLEALQADAIIDDYNEFAEAAKRLKPGLFVTL